jgi:cytochrome c-type biogenesis protein CcmI
MIFSWQFLIMLIMTCLFIGWFLYRPIKSGLSQDESNISINKQRQEELEIDINQGLIDDEQFQVAGSEIVNTLANELTNNNKASVKIKPINWSIAVFICLSALSIALYSAVVTKVPSR